MDGFRVNQESKRIPRALSIRVPCIDFAKVHGDEFISKYKRDEASFSPPNL
jgi:hypothetical protein